MKSIYSEEEVIIADRKIGTAHPPFIIAEMSGNHNQSLERAIKIVEAAAKTGADAVKLQTYTADTLTIDLTEKEFFIDDPKSLWHGKSLHELYNEAHTPWDWHEPIMNRCKELGLICFSTPFDESAVDFLESLSVPAYKIASFENNHLPLIRKVAAIGKPLLLSTGMATVADLEYSVNAARNAGCRNIILLKCTSTYPASPENSNLLTIPHMRELFGCQVGLSDHTMGTGTAVASIVLGSTVIEKHFTLKRSDGGVDGAFSLEPKEMKSLTIETKRAWHALGQVSYGPTAKENDSMVFRRSIYIVRDMRAGDTLTPDNIRIIRPGFGLSPRYYEILLGRSIKVATRRGTPVTWNLI